MVRVKKARNALKTRKNMLRMVKGYRFGRSSKEKMAQEAIFHAGSYAFAHRRDKKGDFRRIWTTRINAALDPMGLSYSKVMGAIKKQNIQVDRKILAELAEKNPETFKRIIAQVK